MNKTVFTIMKKEFARFFGDKRMVFSTILMPGIMIYVMYSFLGSALAEQFVASDDYVYEVHVVNFPNSFAWLSGEEGLLIKKADGKDIAALKQKIAGQETELLVVFPEQFDRQLTQDGSFAKGKAPVIEMYYNSVFTESLAVYERMCGVFEEYEASLVNKFDINTASGRQYDLATEKDMTAQLFSMMLPMLLMSFLFSGCLAIAPESIAGEKERGTIATLLVTPVNRSSLAIGKIISLSVIGLFAGISSFLGTVLSVPKVMGNMAGELTGLGAAMYSGRDYLMLLLVILSTVLVIISMISVLSGLAKSVREAGTASTPFMVISMVIGITSMFGDGAPEQFWWYLIPLYNSVQCMNGIFSFTMIPLNLAVTVFCNLFFSIVMGTVLTKIFDSEKMMYI